LKALIAIRRDHLDSGSVTSPNRETGHGSLLDVGMTICG
jgi:urocanate hydratase